MKIWYPFTGRSLVDGMGNDINVQKQSGMYTVEDIDSFIKQFRKHIEGKMQINNCMFPVTVEDKVSHARTESFNSAIMYVGQELERFYKESIENKT